MFSWFHEKLKESAWSKNGQATTSFELFKFKGESTGACFS